MAGQPHHTGRRYLTAARQLRRAGNTDIDAVCWRCGLTLPEHPPHVDGKPQRWTAGHTIKGSTTWRLWLNVTVQPPAGDWLALEASRCNGAAENDARRHAHRTGYTW